MFDNETTDDQSRVNALATGIGKMFGIDGRTPVPREELPQFDPAVLGIEFHLAKVAEFFNLELML